MTKRVLTDALAAGDLPAAVAALDQNVVFHSPILATTGNEVRGHTVVVKILQTAFACFGMPRNVDEFQNYTGRYIVTFDGGIGGNLIQVAILVTENAAGKVESLRVFARPWPIVKLFREFMERNLRPDPVPDAIWNLPAKNAIGARDLPRAIAEMLDGKVVEWMEHVTDEQYGR